MVFHFINTEYHYYFQKHSGENSLFCSAISFYNQSGGGGGGGGILLSNSTNFKKRQILKQDKSTLKSKNGCPNHF